mmetsp:Transcript_135123/g.431837  ORF Transcript_135123/g.431837 Transcript_135123/m.431837 type:complete len:242 (+) Transcript_135123:194-919(+)
MWCNGMHMLGCGRSPVRFSGRGRKCGRTGPQAQRRGRNRGGATAKTLDELALLEELLLKRGNLGLKPQIRGPNRSVVEFLPLVLQRLVEPNGRRRPRRDGRRQVSPEALDLGTQIGDAPLQGLLPLLRGGHRRVHGLQLPLRPLLALAPGLSGDLQGLQLPAQGLRPVHQLREPGALLPRSVSQLLKCGRQLPPLLLQPRQTAAVLLQRLHGLLCPCCRAAPATGAARPLSATCSEWPEVQ